RNVISGNRTNGVAVTGPGGTGNLIAGNFIGTNFSGSAALANGSPGAMSDGHGLFISAPSNTVGPDNVISGNFNDGVRIEGSGATGNRVEGNFIGTDAAGSAAVGNGGDGVAMGSV